MTPEAKLLTSYVWDSEPMLDAAKRYCNSNKATANRIRIGKWEMLFHDDGRLIKSVAERISGTPKVANPMLSDPDKPEAAYVPYEATIPASRRC